MDISDWLIETALEAAPPEHREAVYSRMRGVADKALDVLMPDQHDVRRRLVGALPERPMPLSDHEYVKTLGVVDDRGAEAVSLPSAQAGGLPDPTPGSLATIRNGRARLLPSRRSGESIGDSGSAGASSSQAGASPSQHRPVPDSYLAPALAGGLRAARAAGELDADASATSPGTRPTSTELDRQCDQRGTSPALHPTAGRALSDPPNGGIMSPKMSAATKCDVSPTESPDHGRTPPRGASPFSTDSQNGATVAAKNRANRSVAIDPVGRGSGIKRRRGMRSALPPRAPPRPDLRTPPRCGRIVRRSPKCSRRRSASLGSW
jgi:hypothetical protein